MAPTVPIADSRPTTDPVRARSRSWILTTVGLTADSTAAGSRQHRVAKVTMPTGSDRSRMPPAMLTMGTTASVSAPPRMSSGPRSRLGSTRSAMRPPTHVPSAMPARIVPMMPVHVSRVTPRYGASNRPASVLRAPGPPPRSPGRPAPPATSTWAQRSGGPRGGSAGLVPIGPRATRRVLRARSRSPPRSPRSGRGMCVNAVIGFLLPGRSCPRCGDQARERTAAGGPVSNLPAASGDLDPAWCHLAWPHGGSAPSPTSSVVGHTSSVALTALTGRGYPARGAVERSPHTTRHDQEGARSQMKQEPRLHQHRSGRAANAAASRRRGRGRRVPFVGRPRREQRP